MVPDKKQREEKGINQFSQKLNSIARKETYFAAPSRDGASRTYYGTYFDASSPNGASEKASA